jgi:hypothetical protein
MTEEIEMANIKETAMAFEPKTTKNVADLEALDVNWPVEERTGTDNEGKEFAYKVVVKDGEDYRVPNSVLSQIKTILEAKPSQEKVRVVKKGTGMNTEYTVIQMD